MTAMNERARQRLGSGYAAYIRLKLQGIANDVADIVARAYATSDSGQASFVRAVMLATIAHRFPADRAEVTDALIRFLRTFDLAFTDRRLRFVIQGVNDAYRQDTPGSDRSTLIAGSSWTWSRRSCTPGSRSMGGRLAGIGPGGRGPRAVRAVR